MRWLVLCPYVGRRFRTCVFAQDGGVRSCAVAFMLHGDYARAEDYLTLDMGSEWEKATGLSEARSAT